jgi:hypothetical protein
VAEPSALEKTAMEAPGASHGKEKKKPIGTLESVLNETGELISKTAKVGLGIAAPLTFASMVPTFARDTYILTGAQVASDATLSYKAKKKYTAGNFLESAVLGTAMTPVIETMFRGANSIPTNDLMGYVTKGSVWGGVMYPFFVGAYQPIAYLIRNRTFKGMGKYVKENYWPSLKKAWKTLLPLSLANIFFAPAWLQIPVSAGLSYMFDLFGAPQKEEVPEHMKKDTTPYHVATSRVIGKAGKTVFYGGGQVLDAIIETTKDWIYKSPPKPASQAAAPANA